MKKALLSFAATLFTLLSAVPAHAATTITSGDLIKGPGDTVYYYGLNGKRYVFPTAKTYLTWYPDFSTVKTISAGDLAAIPLGGNVTYRPGVKLVKITTDPKTYAVATNGTLRWVQTEQAAKDLYGADWNTKIDDIPDAFFINYTMGANIVNASDYSPSQQTLAAKDINTEKRLNGDVTTPPTTPPPTQPAPTSTTPTESVNFTVSKQTVQPGDVETLNASYTGTTNVSKIELFFNSQLVKTCTVSSCSGDALVPTTGAAASYIAEARITKVTADVISKTLTVTSQTDGQSLVQIRIGQSVITSGQAASAVADADASIAINRIDISVDGTFVKGCATGARACGWSDYLTGANGSTHPVYARVTDTLGRTYTSKTLTITIGTNDLPGVTVTPAKTTIYPGETVDITVMASDNDGIASIDVMKDGVSLKHCTGGAPCTATTGPWMTAGTVLTFTGQAVDAKANIGNTMDSATVSVVAH